ncbi:MAG: squalene synthase HpnC [Chloroflexota bacterium]
MQEAEAFTRRLAHRHYENFLVVSWLLPRRLHQHMFNVYAYCRGVDDLGDEAPGDRLALLDAWEQELNACCAGQATNPTFVALASTMRACELPPQLLRDLIQANRQDQLVQRYERYDDLVAYCRLSANPVGRLVLHLFGVADEQRALLADATCTALQLANFWQDVTSDYAERGRIYLPLEDLRRFDYSEEDLAAHRVNERWRQLMHFEIQRTRELFATGRGLLPLVERRLRVDLQLFMLGGLEVLQRIETRGYDVLTARPKVPSWRQAMLLLSALRGALAGGGR